MRFINQQAEVELNRKLRMEARLRRELSSVWTDLTHKFITSYGTFRIIPGTEDERAKIESILTEHYVRVSQRFGFRIRKHLPAKLKMTGEEKLRFDMAMGSAFAQRAIQQSRLITHNTEKLLDESVGNAAKVRKDASFNEIVSLAADMFRNRSMVRANTVAVYETQWAAEASKFAEASILAGIQINVKANRRKQTYKRWDTVGDNRVRDHHLAVDGVIVPADKPFLVNGESLLYPGDSSLGASAGNIINCRCGAVYEVDSIAEARQDLSSFRSIADLVRDLNVLFGK